MFFLFCIPPRVPKLHAPNKEILSGHECFNLCLFVDLMHTLEKTTKKLS